MDIALPVLGGLGLFLYGMNLMGNGLQKAAGSRLRKLIEVLTNNRFMGVLVGIIVTMIVQSSSATSVMVIGFVNAGLMTLTQAVGVIMGANVGTTVTAQLIAFDIIKYAPLAIAIGVAYWIASSKKKHKDTAEILIGFGLLFIGMDMMSTGLAPLADNQIFVNMMVNLNNPIVGMLAGVVLTTVFQSSSAAIGLLQALAGQGLVTMNMSFPVLFGENIGTTTTGLISSLGANKTAKRAAIIHFLFNLVGTIIFMTVLRMPIQALVVRITPYDVKRQIANAHTLFNIINLIIQFPFAGLLVKAAQFLVPGEDKAAAKASIYLDERIIETPSIALGQVNKEINRMGDLVLNNLILANEVFSDEKYSGIELVYEQEQLINKIEKEITDYLVKLSKASLSEKQNAEINILFYTINDIERVGDHVENIVELSEYKLKNNLSFTRDAIDELHEMFEACIAAFSKTMIAFETGNELIAREVLVIEDKVDMLESKNRANHIDRLSKMECETGPGIVFLDAISNLERVADHSVNIATYIIDKLENK